MLTPELYYKMYKEKSNLVSNKITNIIIFILTLLLALGTISQDYKIFITILLFDFLIATIVGKLIFKLKIKKLRELTNNYSISNNNYREELELYVISNLKNILKSYKISKCIYDNFYRNQLLEYQQEKRNILKDKPYLTFMLGVSFASFVNNFFNFTSTSFYEHIIQNFSVLFFLTALISLISFMIFSINDSLIDKSKDVNKLIFYTEIIFLNSEK